MIRLHNIVIAVKAQKPLVDVLQLMANHQQFKLIENLHMTLILIQTHEDDADWLQDELTEHVKYKYTTPNLAQQKMVLPFLKFLKLGSKIAAVFDQNQKLIQIHKDLLNYVKSLYKEHQAEIHNKEKGPELWFHNHDGMLRAIVHIDYVPHISFAQAKHTEIPPHQILPDLIVEELFVYRGKSIIKD